MKRYVWIVLLSAALVRDSEALKDSAIQTEATVAQGLAVYLPQVLSGKTHVATPITSIGGGLRNAFGDERGLITRVGNRVERHEFVAGSVRQLLVARYEHAPMFRDGSRLYAADAGRLRAYDTGLDGPAGLAWDQALDPGQSLIGVSDGLALIYANSRSFARDEIVFAALSEPGEIIELLRVENLGFRRKVVAQDGNLAISMRASGFSRTSPHEATIGFFRRDEAGPVYRQITVPRSMGIDWDVAAIEGERVVILRDAQRISSNRACFETEAAIVDFSTGPQGRLVRLGAWIPERVVRRVHPMEDGRWVLELSQVCDGSGTRAFLAVGPHVAEASERFEIAAQVPFEGRLVRAGENQFYQLDHPANGLVARELRVDADPDRFTLGGRRRLGIIRELALGGRYPDGRFLDDERWMSIDQDGLSIARLERSGADLRATFDQHIPIPLSATPITTTQAAGTSERLFVFDPVGPQLRVYDRQDDRFVERDGQALPATEAFNLLQGDGVVVAVPESVFDRCAFGPVLFLPLKSDDPLLEAGRLAAREVCGASLDGGRLYLFSKREGQAARQLEVVEVADPRRPSVVDTGLSFDDITWFVVQQDLLLLSSFAEGEWTVSHYDMRDPASPKQTILSPAQAGRLRTGGRCAGQPGLFLGSGSVYSEVIDWTTWPASPGRVYLDCPDCDHHSSGAPCAASESFLAVNAFGGWALFERQNW